MPQLKQYRETNDKWVRQTAVFCLVQFCSSDIIKSFQHIFKSLAVWESVGSGKNRQWQRMGKNPEWNVGCQNKLFIVREVTMKGSWETFPSLQKLLNVESQVALLNCTSFLGDGKTWIIFPHLDQSSHMSLVKKDGGKKKSSQVWCYILHFIQ